MNNNYISREDFCAIHEVSPDNLDVCIHNGTAPKSTLRNDGGDYKINESYYLRQMRKKQMINKFNQDMFMLLNQHPTSLNSRSSGHFSTTQLNSLSRFGVSGYLEREIFTINRKSILAQRLTQNERKWFMFFREFKRHIERKIGHKIDIDYLLDKRI